MKFKGIATTFVVLLALLLAIPLSAQVNGQKLASDYNFDVNSIASSGLGDFVFPASVCTNAVNVHGKAINPFIAADTLMIIDQIAASNETLAQTVSTFSGGYCTLHPTSASYSHYSYHLKSGTCGLVAAIKDSGTTGTILVDQSFYNSGCTAATITGTVVAAVGKAGIVINDISAGKNDLYAFNGTAYAKVNTAPVSPNMASLQFFVNEELITLSTTLATTDSTANLLPANSLILGVGGIVQTAISGGTCNSWSVGDGSTAARFIAADSTLTANEKKANTGTAWTTGIASATTGIYQASAAKVRITCGVGNSTAGKVRVTVMGFTAVPPQQ